MKRSDQAAEKRRNLKAMSTPERREFYFREKQQCVQEQERRNQEFDHMSVGAKQNKSSSCDVIEVDRYLTFKEWAMREIVLGACKDLKAATEAWKRELAKDGAKVKHLRGQWLLGEFNGLNVQKVKSNSTDVVVALSKDVVDPDSAPVIIEQAVKLADQHGNSYQGLRLCPGGSDIEPRVSEASVVQQTETDTTNSQLSRDAIWPLKRKIEQDAQEDVNFGSELVSGAHSRAESGPKKPKIEK